MKKLQQLCFAVVLVLVLTTTTFAGEIDTGGKTPPPQPPAPATSSREIPVGHDYRLIENLALDLLRTMLSIL